MRRFVILVTCFLVVCSPMGPDPVGRPDPADAPRLSAVSPAAAEVRIELGTSVEFHVDATSPIRKPLTITFLVDGEPRTTAATFRFEPATISTFQVTALVSDGELDVVRQWTVTVTPPPNVPPGVVLSVEPGGGEAPLTARIQVQGEDRDGQVVRHRLELTGPASLILEREAPIDTVLSLGAGSWRATAIVEDDRGSTAVATRGIEVAARNVAPTPTLRVDPASGEAPLVILVDGAGIDADGTIVSYRLEVEGEFTIESAAPIQRSARLEDPGTFWVRLAVTDDRGAVAFDSLAVLVSPAASAPPSGPAPAPPGASLVVTPLEGVAPLEVTAHVEGADSDGVVIASRIDFDGDGVPEAFSEGPSLNATFRFAEAGSYEVRATVVDDDGAAGTARATVTVRPPANLPPTGTLSLSVTSGDAPLEVRAFATGFDPDGSIERWEIEASEGDGFVDLDASRSATLVYGFDEAVYRPRLRLTDDGGTSVTIVGPSVTVYRPIGRGTASVRGNSRFDGTAIAPAVWSDGADRWRLDVTVLDGDGNPLPGVPLRLASERAPLVAPDGISLGPGVSVAPGELRTTADGSAAGTFTTTLSTRIERAPIIDFQPFGLRIEADAGHGQWREVARVAGLNANTTVSATTSRVIVHPASTAVCPGTPIEFEVRARSRSDAPEPGAPAGGRYAELRYTDGSLLGAVPLAGYPGWRTDPAGVIRFGYAPTRSDQSKLVEAWVDGQPIGELVIIALEPASRCSS